MSLFFCFCYLSHFGRRTAKLLMAVIVVSLQLACTDMIRAADHQQKQSIDKSGLPEGLVAHLDHFESLRIDHLPIKDFKWLHARLLSELEINQTGLQSLSGIGGAKELSTLTLTLRESPISSLKEVAGLKKLRNLTISLDSSRNVHLVDLASSPIETLRLILPNGDTPDFSELARLHNPKTLRNLKVLRIDIKGDVRVRRPDFKLKGLEAFKQIKTLVLDLEASAIQELPDLSALVNLTALEVNVRNTKQITSLANLKTKNPLTTLTLNLESSLVRELPNFESFQGLTTLKLTLNKPTQLPQSFSQLVNLQSLNLDLSQTLIDTLPDLSGFSDLTTLSLTVNSRGIADLSPIGKANHLTDLALDLKHSNVGDIWFLKSLNALKSLDIDCFDAASIQDFSVLANVKSLKNLTVHLEWSKTHLLPDLSQLPDFYEFSIHLEGFLQNRESSERLSRILQLSRPTSLVLNLGGTQIEEFPAYIPDSIHSLTLDIGGSQIKSLESLSRATQLEWLDLNLQRVYHLTKLPNLSALKSLSCVSIDLQGSKMADLSELLHLKGPLSLFLDLRDSKVEKLPELNRRHMQEATLILQNSAITDLQSIRDWDFLKYLTVDEQVQSLALMPVSVRHLDFMEPPPFQPCRMHQ